MSTRFAQVGDTVTIAGFGLPLASQLSDGTLAHAPTATISSFPFVNQPWVAQLSNGMLSDQFGGQGNGLILPAGVAWAPPQPARPSGQI